MHLVRILMLALLPLFAPNPSAVKPTSQPACKPCVPEKPVLEFTPWRTRIWVTTYQVTLPIERVDELNRDHLERAAATSHDFVSALKALGDLRLLNLTDQFIGSGVQERIQLGASRPTPTGSQSFKGQTSTQVQYQDAGSIVEVTTAWRRENPMQGMLDLRVELSGIVDSEIQLAPGAFAPVIYRIDQKHSGPIRSGEPYLLISIDGSNRGLKAYAYITRAVFFRTEITDADAKTNP
jgi:hypothetical protein